jgi:hypothetical protein
MIRYFILYFLFFLFLRSNAQQEPYTQFYDSLQKYEHLMKCLGDSILDGTNEFVRMDALTDFIPMFVKTLKIPGSYNYPFDSLHFLYKLVAPDNAFRLYSWTLKFDNRTFRYYGAIHFNNPEKLNLIPLYDKSDSVEFQNLEDTVLTNEEWYGMQYYDIGMFVSKRKKYYFLLGWDGGTSAGYYKFIELLSFENGKPVFGAPLIKEGKQVKSRKVFQYNKTAFFTLKYIPEKKVIAFDNLVSPNENSTGKLWLYIPDGSYDYFQVKGGKLVFKKGLFEHVKMPDDGLNMNKQQRGPR